MNTERPDDDTARGPEDRGAREETRSEQTRPGDLVREQTLREEPVGESPREAVREESPPEEPVQQESPREKPLRERPDGDAGGGADRGGTDRGRADGSGADGGGADGGGADRSQADDGRADRSQADDGRADRSQADDGRADGGEADGGEADGGRFVGEVTGDGSSGGRRRSHLFVASVAAAVLLVGGGGAYLAASTTGGAGGGSGAGAPSGDGTPPVLVLDDYAGGGSGGAVNGIAPGEPNPYGVTYRAEGTLPDGPGSAAVYWARGEVTADEVTRLAAALGVDGTPVSQGQEWRVGSVTDGSGPVLRVNRQAPGPWTFNRYTPGTDTCASATGCDKDSADPSATPVSEAAAKKAAAPVLKALGQDDAKIDASQVVGAQRVVNADPEIGGLPTHGWTTGVTVNVRAEVVAGGGQVRTPVKGDTYPVLSARETLDRMNAAPGTDPRTGIGGCADPVPLEEGPADPCGTSTAAPHQQSPTVADAVFGLAPHASGGRQVLVPSWLFEVRDAGGEHTVTHPAVEPEYLSAPPASTPPAEPSPGGKTSDVSVDGYTAQGDELTVAFTGGVCSDYAATAVESGDEVRVTVTATSWPEQVCIAIAQLHHRTVELEEPLGGRTVVGSDGGEIPLEKPGARLP
ncbi:hypothetical protein [Streptomyces sp. NPDC059894]|uniref:hypothetical protein n=1 Tax=unclassified Streptomyces TaxID=2593676 RepID=UPI003665C61F